MAVDITGTFKPAGDFPVVEAADVAMPDGSRLSECGVGNYKVVEGAATIEPGKYYVFGEVSSLAIELAEADETLANEYCFEFVAAEGFNTLAITPEPRWVSSPTFFTGKTHQVSILRGIGVMVCA